VDRVWLCVGILSCFSMIVLRSETVLLFGLSSVTRSRPSRLRILSIMVSVLGFVLCDVYDWEDEEGFMEMNGI